MEKNEDRTTEKSYSRKGLMKIAIDEHLKCMEFPRVGAVIAKNGLILSTGYRGERAGVHAERIAIEKLKPEQLAGSTLFTTLEPCVILQPGQQVEPCAKLIMKSRIAEVVIGVLDPNGTIYSQGYESLLGSNINVNFFDRDLQVIIEEETFKVGSVDMLIGSGTRRIPVVHSGTSLTIQFSATDLRTIKLRWSSLQPAHDCVDLLSENGAVRVASGATNFSDITDPMVFRFPSHFARMRKGMIAVVKPSGASFCVLVKLVELHEKDISFQWEVRND